MVVVKLIGNEQNAVYSVLNVNDCVQRHARAMRDRLGYTDSTACGKKWRMTCNGVPVGDKVTFKALGVEGKAVCRLHIEKLEKKKRLAASPECVDATEPWATVLGGGNSGQEVTYTFPHAGRVVIRKCYRFHGGGTGSVAWDAAFVLAAYLDAHPIPKTQGVVELGAGLGTPSIIAGLRGAAYVVATDGDMNIMPLLIGNVRGILRGLFNRAVAQRYLWGDEAGFAALQAAVAALQASQMEGTGQPCPSPVLLAADVLYRGSAAAWRGLRWTLERLLTHDNYMLLAATEREGRPDEKFLASLAHEMFGVELLAPQRVGSKLPQTTHIYRITRRQEDAAEPRAITCTASGSVAEPDAPAAS
eukprot:TRINITY_DN5609_c0_g1_i1.p1 TRINITY_DN5609_c0_g1~~TRINITY_DN5609_c0_g1_i1.p1  ORF type:complete len:360 (+),score=66.84 TRINITY_DN5609_c0_g1_i1:276-1355(+)